MDDRLALIKACIDNPGEDTPRLMLADWMDENESPFEATVLRIEGGEWWVNAKAELHYRSAFACVWPNLEWGDTPVCQGCHRDHDIFLAVDPFEEEVHNRIEWLWFCAPCQTERARDI